MVPCNAVLRRADVDDTVEDALTYYHAVVGNRTPHELQETFVRGGAPLVDYLEQDEHVAFELLPWPDHYAKAPKARLDGMRHMTAAPLPASGLGELRSGNPIGTSMVFSPRAALDMAGRELD